MVDVYMFMMTLSRKSLMVDVYMLMMTLSRKSLIFCGEFECRRRCMLPVIMCSWSSDHFSLLGYLVIVVYEYYSLSYLFLLGGKTVVLVQCSFTWFLSFLTCSIILFFQNGYICFQVYSTIDTSNSLTKRRMII